MVLSKINPRYNSASGISGARKIYMIGIKGVGMTMLAQFLAEQGVKIIGSDTDEKFMTDDVLKRSGIIVIENFDKNNIPRDVDLIIYSGAYSAEQNEEVAAALEGKSKVLVYAEALGEVFNCKFGIAVTGSHGKTTISAWLGYVLERSGKQPNVMAASHVPQFDGASLIGKSELLVAEVDEYQNKLKYFNPKAVLLSNIDYDHPDFFPTPEDYINVFIDFIKKISSKGFLIANFDDSIIRKVAKVNCKGKVITYAINEAADYVAYDIKSQNGKQYFRVKLGVDEETDVANSARSYQSPPVGGSFQDDSYDDSGDLGDFSIGLSGRHNISNALAVIAACIELGVELTDIRNYLGEFKGATRRAQIMGKFRGAMIIDDYAHHPTEIKTTLAGIREIYKNRKIITVFHPHTFTRTKVLFDEFAGSFKDTDELIVLDIYGSAREKQGKVHSKDLVEKIGIRNKELEIRQNILHIPTLDKCEEYLRENVERDDVVVLMGAGDVFRIGENLLK